MKSVGAVVLMTILILSCAHNQHTAKSKNPPLVGPGTAALTRDEALKRLLPLSANPNEDVQLTKSSREFSLSFPVEKLEGDQKREWHNTSVKVFYSSPEKVTQVGITTISCNTRETEENKVKIQSRVAQLVELISEKLLGAPFLLNGERYFKELGPNWERNVQVTLAEPYSPTKSMRLSRDIYKCDGLGGFGFRYDFFLR